MTIVTATLDWDGVWEIKENDIPSGIPDEEGIYMVLCGKRSAMSNKWDPSSYKLLYIGEADKVRSRIYGHEKWPRWNQNCSNHILLKVASCNLGTTRRQKAECCLIYRNKPICNDECKQEFPYEDDVEITNTGSYSPLSSKQSC